MKTPIHNTLREYRTKAGLRQLDVACKLGFNNTDRISRWENGTAFPSVRNLLKMAKILGVHAEDLYPTMEL